MKYIQCTNYNNEVSLINVDKIVSITKTLDRSIAIITVNDETFYTTYDSLKNPIEFEKISEII